MRCRIPRGRKRSTSYPICPTTCSKRAATPRNSSRPPSSIADFFGGSVASRLGAGQRRSGAPFSADVGYPRDPCPHQERGQCEPVKFLHELDQPFPTVSEKETDARN